jgi:hypothetical protein
MNKRESIKKILLWATRKTPAVFLTAKLKIFINEKPSFLALSLAQKIFSDRLFPLKGTVTYPSIHASYLEVRPLK